MPPPVSPTFARFDASELTSITDAGAGAVSQWNDLSGNGNHATQAVAGSRPITGTRTRNGRNVIDFTGNKFLESALSDSTRPVSVFMVVQFDTWGSGGDSPLGPASPGGGGMQIQVTQSNSKFKVTKAGTGILAEHDTELVTPSNPYVFGFVLDASTITSTLNGGAAETDSDSTTFEAAMTTRIGGKYPDRFWGGWIGEIVVYNSALSATDRQAVEQYLMRKWINPLPTLPVAGATAWYDAADLSTFSTAADGAVNEWRDKTANGYNLLGTVGTRPHSGTRQLRGRNVVDFDGTVETLVTSTVLPDPTPQPVTIFAVFQADTFTGGASRQEFVAISTDGPEMSLDATAGFRWRFRAFGSDVFGGEADLRAHVMTGLANGGSSAVWLDGKQVGTGSLGASAVSGLGISVGSEPGSAFFNGIVAEVLLYPSQLSEVDRKTVEEYLYRKWLAVGDHRVRVQQHYVVHRHAKIRLKPRPSAKATPMLSAAEAAARREDDAVNELLSIIFEEP